MAFHVLWGLVLWFSISKYGLGISTDSVHLLFGGLNLSEGRGLISFNDGFLLNWPPLYPMLLALTHLVTGLDVFTAAHLLQVVSFLGLSLCLSILFIKIFPENFSLALAANILSDIGVIVLTGFDMVGSDYVHLFLVILLILLAGYYIERQSPRVLLAISAVGMLAMLQRYLGIAAIATSAAAVFFFTSGGLWQRIVRSLLMALSVLPAGIWLLVTSRLIERRAPIGFMENFMSFSEAILDWFFPAEAVRNHLIPSVVLLWIFVIGLVLLLFSFSSRYRVLSPFTIPVFGFGLLYSLALFGSASITYFNKLGGRFLLPLYIPFIALLVVSVDILLRLASKLDSQFIRRVVSIGLVGVLIFVAVLLSRITFPVVLKSRVNGAVVGDNVFNTVTWHENKALQYWLEHQPSGDYLLFSNYPDGIAFYTWHPCASSPRRYSGPYGKEEIPVAQYADQLFSSGLDVYIIWIEPNDHSYFYKVEELSSIAQIEPLFVSKDGSIYRLKPKSES